MLQYTYKQFVHLHSHTDYLIDAQSVNMMINRVDIGMDTIADLQTTEI